MRLKYKDWLSEVPEEFTNDSLWRMKVYRYALFLSDIAWNDVCQLSENKLLISFCDQLYRSAGSVSANISEGYLKKSKRGRARFYEYALGSARECRGWYFKLRHQLDKDVGPRLKLLTEIIKMLLYIVLQKRGQKIKEAGVSYSLENIKSDWIEDVEF